MSFRRGFLFSLVAVACTSMSFMAGYIVRANQHPGLDQFPILNQAYSILSEHALHDLPEPPILEYGMIRGMVQAYDDPYTIFVEPVQHELETNSLEGEFGGIGVQLSRNQNGEVILFPLPDSPAAQAGVQEGDRLIAVENLQIGPETSIETIQAAIRGPEGKSVKLLIGHTPDFLPVEISIRRAAVSLPSVTWHLDPDNPQIGIIKINTIAASTPDEIQKAVRDLESKEATSFILDLRDNGGGLLTTGVDTARLFLKAGVVIQQQYREQAVETFRVEKPGPLRDIPLAILVNHGTASAAEIIAGALQAHQRAPLIGAPTFGKDTVQLVFDLKDGSSLHVTAGHWWIPDLSLPLADKGLQPDIAVSSDDSNPNSAIAAASKILLGGH
ncbi:MAG TPA: S41 family peptidase [Anaerolineales bacterium]|nr:S41 family peptidase [Anaerolineales bacterium]